MSDKIKIIRYIKIFFSNFTLILVLKFNIEQIKINLLIAYNHIKVKFETLKILHFRKKYIFHILEEGKGKLILTFTFDYTLVSIF